MKYYYKKKHINKSKKFSNSIYHFMLSIDFKICTSYFLKSYIKIYSMIQF